MLPCISKLVELEEGDFLRLVFPDFIIRLENLILNAYFLDVKLWTDGYIFYLKLKRETSLNQVSWVEDLHHFRRLVNFNKIAAMGSQRPQWYFHLAYLAPLRENADNSSERKLIQETLNGDVTESKHLKVLRLPIRIAVLVVVHGLNVRQISTERRYFWWFLEMNC